MLRNCSTVIIILSSSPTHEISIHFVKNLVIFAMNRIQIVFSLWMGPKKPKEGPRIRSGKTTSSIYLKIMAGLQNLDGFLQWAIVKVFLSNQTFLWIIYPNEFCYQIILNIFSQVLKENVVNFRNSSECLKTHCAANNWPI